VSGDHPRLQELRRRVQGDPASIAFAQLAEECRRAGDPVEAIRISRDGLAHHPGYLSARVTLGRALIEVNQLDEARHELSTVLQAAPENLAAIRAIADIHQRQGRLTDALEFYRRALSLARFDPELEAAVERMTQALAVPPAPKPAIAPPADVAVEDLFDFDALVQQLGSQVTTPSAPPHEEPPAAVPSVVDSAVVVNDDDDPLSVLEQRLREKAAAPYEKEPAVDADRREQQALAEEQHRLAESARRQAQRVMQDLESWLVAIVSDRSQGA